MIARDRAARSAEAPAMKAAQSRVARADERVRQNRSEGRRARHGYTLR